MTITASAGPAGRPMLSSPWPAPVPGIPAETTIRAALSWMWQAHSKYLPAHHHGRFVGLVSERDLLSALASGQVSGQDPVTVVPFGPTPTQQVPATIEEMAAAMHGYGSDVLVLCNGATTVSLMTAMDLLGMIFPAETAAGRRASSADHIPGRED